MRSCPFGPLTGRSLLGNFRCLCVLLFSFVNVIRFSCVTSHSCFMCWPMRHLCDQALRRRKAETHVPRTPVVRNLEFADRAWAGPRDRTRKFCTTDVGLVRAFLPFVRLLILHVSCTQKSQRTHGQKKKKKKKKKSCVRFTVAYNYVCCKLLHRLLW